MMLGFDHPETLQLLGLVDWWLHMVLFPRVPPISYWWQVGNKRIESLYSTFLHSLLPPVRYGHHPYLAWPQLGRSPSGLIVTVTLVMNYSCSGDPFSTASTSRLHLPITSSFSSSCYFFCDHSLYCSASQTHGFPLALPKKQPLRDS